jgi:preprotein translocase subunit SecG
MKAFIITVIFIIVFIVLAIFSSSNDLGDDE